jgi:mannose-6-phosphate isomerase-like protein (cupin superfamily)
LSRSTRAVSLTLLTGTAIVALCGISLRVHAQPRTAQPQSAAPLGGALPPGEYSKIPLTPDQGEPFQYLATDLLRYHAEMQDRAAKGKLGVVAPRDLMNNTVTRTHMYSIVHRAEYTATGQPSNAEQHEGVTDVYFVVAGSGTVIVGGTIEPKRIVRPGEYGGPIAGGKSFKLHAGDILNIPPNSPHATMADKGGMTYVLMKVNVGMYPWSLVNGVP